MSQSERPIVDPYDLETSMLGPGRRYSARALAVGRALDLTRLGCRVMEVAPGCTGWPRYIHHANEELFIILEGEGTLDYGEQSFPVRAGQIAGAGIGPGTAHRLRNTGNGTRRCVAVSTMETPEILEYPDSGKVAAVAGSAPGGPPGARTITAFSRRRQRSITGTTSPVRASRLPHDERIWCSGWDSNPHGAKPLGPKPSASTSSATRAKIRRLPQSAFMDRHPPRREALGRAKHWGHNRELIRAASYLWR